MLETWEVQAAEGKPIDLGAYVQAVNGLSGLLLRLGLDKHTRKVTDLQTYLADRRTPDPCKVRTPMPKENGR